MSSISPKSLCYCGSGVPYTSCCGNAAKLKWNKEAFGRTAENLMHPSLAHLVSRLPTSELDGQIYPPGILVRKMTGRYNLQEIKEKVLLYPEAKTAGVTDARGQTAKISNRQTGIVDLGDMAEPVIDLVRRVYRDEVEPFFQCKLRSMETPQILRYSKGSFYRPHSDSDIIDRSSQRWKKSMDRDLSLLIYLDQEYEGGSLIFPNFDFQLEAQEDLLVAFPSDFRYLHGVMPVISGVRNAIVSWCALQGSPPPQ